MADDLFQASLDKSSKTTLKPFKVLIQPAPARDAAKTTRLAFTPSAGPPEAPTPGPPDQPNVFLQIWEIDTFEKAKHGRGKRPKADGGGDEEEKPKDTNDFLIEIPGFIQQTGRRQFELRVHPAAPPTLGSGKALGWFTLELKDATGRPWKDAEGRDLVVPIVGEGEDEVDLACVLNDAGGKKEHESEWKGGPIVHAANLTHIIGSQLEEGGLTIGFWADLLSKKEKEDLAAARREIAKAGSKAAREELMRGKYHDLYTGLDSANNNDTFASAGEEYERRFHSVGTKDGQLAIACMPFKATGDITGGVKATCEKVDADFVKKFKLAKQDPPKVKRLAMFTHGWGTGIRGGPASGDYEKMKVELAQFVDKVRPFLANDVLVTLFACSTGGGAEEFGEPPAEGPRKHTYVGQGSYADVLCRTLIDKGCADAAVWAHTCPGHTYGNPKLRAFTKDGGADVVWMVKGKPPPERSKRLQIAGSFVSKNRDKDKQVMHVSSIHPGGKVGEIASA